MILFPKSLTLGSCIFPKRAWHSLVFFPEQRKQIGIREGFGLGSTTTAPPSEASSALCFNNVVFPLCAEPIAGQQQPSAFGSIVDNPFFFIKYFLLTNKVSITCSFYFVNLKKNNKFMLCIMQTFSCLLCWSLHWVGPGSHWREPAAHPESKGYLSTCKQNHGFLLLSINSPLKSVSHQVLCAFRVSDNNLTGQFWFLPCPGRRHLFGFFPREWLCQWKDDKGKHGQEVNVELPSWVSFPAEGRGLVWGFAIMSVVWDGNYFNSNRDIKTLTATALPARP